MKLAPLLLLAAVGCSAADSNTTTTLTPLVTTTVIPQFNTLPGEKIYTQEEFAFFDDVRYFFHGNLTLDNDSMLEYGRLWCELMTEGMNDTDVVERINEGGTDNEDRKMHFSVVLSGISNLCPDQSAKAEYIALNMPLP